MTPMADPNVFSPEWDAELTDPPFRARVSRVANRAGGAELGASLFDVEPGGAVSPYHVHHGNEELLIVLAGRPELRTPDGRRMLEPGAVVAFPRGPEGAHQVLNPGPDVARVLLVSTMHHPEVVEHLDTGATLALLGPAEGSVFPTGADVPFMDAVVAAMEAGVAKDER
jgi:uncharacterized cupin superfamily protein